MDLIYIFILVFRVILMDLIYIFISKDIFILAVVTTFGGYNIP